jgi:hypothetical protein
VIPDGDNQQSVTAAIPVGVKTFLPIRQEGDEH